MRFGISSSEWERIYLVLPEGLAANPRLSERDFLVELMVEDSAHAVPPALRQKTVLKVSHTLRKLRVLI